MCTLVILRRPEHRWPVLIAANRDEMIERPWQAPGRHGVGDSDGKTPEVVRCHCLQQVVGEV